MFKPLLRTLPNICGNVKLACYLGDYTTTDKFKNDFESNIRIAKLVPINSIAWQNICYAKLLDSSWEFDVARFYKTYIKSFYESTFKFNKKDLKEINFTEVISNRDEDFEMGCSRKSYSKNSKNEFEFFAPIWIENEKDIPDNFVLEIKLFNHYRTLNKTVKIHIKDKNTLTSNYLYHYLEKYAKKLDTNVIFMNPSNKQTLYYGIDILYGGFLKKYDNIKINLFNEQQTIYNFDQILSNGFKRNNMIIKQVIPLAFNFTLDDIITEEEYNGFKNCNVSIKGYYYHNNVKTYFYDWDHNYDDYKDKISVFNKYTGNTEYVYGPNVMNIGYPACNDGLYKNYLYPKMTVNTTRWKLKYSSDDYPYVTNNNVAFSLMQNSNHKYKDYPSNYTKITAIAKKQYNNLYDIILPIGENTKHKDGYVYNKFRSLADRYVQIQNNYISNWFTIKNRFDNIFEEDCWADVEDNKAYYNGILYDFINIYNNNVSVPKFDKFGVFANIITNFKNVNETKKLLFAKKTFIRQNTNTGLSGNTKCNLNDILLTLDFNSEETDYKGLYNIANTGSDIILFDKIFEEVQRDSNSFETYADEFGVNHKKRNMDPNTIGDFINLYDFFENDKKNILMDINEYYRVSDLQKNNIKFRESIINETSKKVENLIYEGYILLPIYYANTFMKGKLPNINIFNNVKLNDLIWLKEHLYYTTIDSPGIYKQVYQLYDEKNNKLSANRLLSNITKQIYKYDTYCSDMYNITFYIKDDFVHKCWVDKDDLKICKNKIKAFTFEPVLQYGNITYAKNVFCEVLDNIGHFYGNYIPKSYIEDDNNVIYMDSFNYENLMQTKLKGVDYFFNTDGDEYKYKANPKYTKKLFVKFLNKFHLKYYVYELYKQLFKKYSESQIAIKPEDADEAGYKKPNIFKDFYIRTRNTIVEDEEFFINDVYISLGDFIIKNNIEKVVDGVRKPIDPEKDFQTDVEQLAFIDNYFQTKYNDRYVFYIPDEYYKDFNSVKLNNGITSDHFYFDLCYWSTMIKINQQIWEQIDVNDNDDSTYLDLYLYTLEAPNNYNSLYNINNNKYYSIKKHSATLDNSDNAYHNNINYYIRDISSCLTPLFNSIMRETENESRIKAEYHINNIVENIKIQEEVPYIKYDKNEFYRFNSDNAVYMYDISHFKTDSKLLDILYERLFKDNMLFPTYNLYKGYKTELQKNNANCVDGLNLYYGHDYTYGYYLINVYIDNTSSSFNFMNEYGDRVKRFEYIENNNIFDITDEILTRAFKHILPFSNIYLFKEFKRMVNTIVVPTTTNISINYISTPIENSEFYDISLKQKNELHQISLSRYFDSITPLITPTHILQNHYMLKLKSVKTQMLVDTDILPLSYHNSAIFKENVSVEKYPNIKYFSSAIDFLKNQESIFTPIEYKYFNDNKFVNLEKKIEISYNRLLNYNEMIEMENDENTIKTFSNYIKNHTVNTYNENEFLFLYNKYNKSYQTQDVYISLKNKKYLLKYIFTLQ